MNFKTFAIKGEGRGRRLGFPTINLDFKNLEMDYGVYTAEAIIGGKKYLGIVHFGPKLTFSNEISLELFAQAQIKNIFEKEIELIIKKKIRSIIKFSDEEELKKQIKNDLKYI
jgi:FAD synthase